MLLEGVRTFGELIEARREELEIPLGAVAELVDHPGWIDSLEQDSLDMRARSNRARWRSLLRILEIRPFVAVREMFLKAVASNLRGPDQAVSLGRVKAGYGDPPARGVRGPSEEYVDAVWAELEKD